MRFFRLQSFVLALGLLATVGLVLNLATPPAYAQADLGSVTGVVTDASGAVIPSAKVAITNPDTGAVRVAQTNGQGEFAITQLLPATYTLTVTAQGFAPAKKTVSVTVGSENSTTVKMAVAGGVTQVIVAADDFAGVQLEKPEVSAVIETNRILALPTLDRDPYNLVACAGNLSADPTAAARGVGFDISGSRNTSVDILLDGAENTDLYAVGIGQTVPLDATSEIRIVTSNSGAEYGRGSGAVNVSTKSGTNGLHGSVYEFNRISTLASDGFNNNYLHAMDRHHRQAAVYAQPVRLLRGRPGQEGQDLLLLLDRVDQDPQRPERRCDGSDPGPDRPVRSNMQSFFSTYGKLATPINGTTYTGASHGGLECVQGRCGVDCGHGERCYTGASDLAHQLRGSADLQCPHLHHSAVRPVHLLGSGRLGRRRACE